MGDRQEISWRKGHLDWEHSKKEGWVSVKELSTVPFQVPTMWNFSLPDGQSPFITLLTFLHLLYLCLSSPKRWRIPPHRCYPVTIQNILSVFFPKNKHPQLQNCGLNHGPRPEHAKEAAPDFNTYTLIYGFRSVHNLYTDKCKKGWCRLCLYNIISTNEPAGQARVLTPDFRLEKQMSFLDPRTPQPT